MIHTVRYLRCDNVGCREYLPFDEGMTYRGVLMQIAERFGWQRIEGKDLCRHCARPLLKDRVGSADKVKEVSMSENPANQDAQSAEPVDAPVPATEAPAPDLAPKRKWYQRFWDAFGNAVGESKFGGGGS